MPVEPDHAVLVFTLYRTSFQQVQAQLRPLAFVDFPEVIKKAETIPAGKAPNPLPLRKHTPTAQLNEPAQQEVEKLSNWLKS